MKDNMKDGIKAKGAAVKAKLKGMKDKAKGGKKCAALVAAFGIAALVCGCATKTRNVEIDGMFTQAEAGILAIGSVDVMATPVGEESAIIKYDEDTAWLSPSTKTHSVKIQLTGTNSTACVTSIVESVCRAFKTENEKCKVENVK